MMKEECHFDLIFLMTVKLFNDVTLWTNHFLSLYSKKTQVLIALCKNIFDLFIVTICI